MMSFMESHNAAQREHDRLEQDGFVCGQKRGRAAILVGEDSTVDAVHTGPEPDGVQPAQLVLCHCACLTPSCFTPLHPSSPLPSASSPLS
eukprot:633291-Rhodomonas_salina.1